jgi:hypothetical protein
VFKKTEHSNMLFTHLRQLKMKKWKKILKQKPQTCNNAINIRQNLDNVLIQNTQEHY